MAYLFNCILHGEIITYQNELKFEYSIQMWSQYYYMLVKLENYQPDNKKIAYIYK
jgi:hypothetical protein